MNTVPKLNGKKPAIRIGMWGPSSAGKTTYVYCLYALSKSMSRHIPFPYIFEPINKPAKELVKQCEDKFGEGRLPSITTDAPVEYHFHLYAKDKPKNVFVDLTMIDAAGGIITENRDLARPYLDSIRDCMGIIAIIDPSQEDSSYKTLDVLLQEFVDPETPGIPNNLFLALSLSKIDIDTFWDNFSLMQYSREYIQERIQSQTFMATPILRRFEDKKQIAYIGFSSVGRYHDGSSEGSNLVRTQYGEVIANMDYWKPFNLTEPLAAILQHYNIKL